MFVQNAASSQVGQNVRKHGKVPDKYVWTKCGKKSKHEKMKGECRCFAWVKTELAVTIK